MSKKTCCFLFLVLLQCCIAALPVRSTGFPSDKDCHVPLSPWWNEVKVSLPDSIVSLDMLRAYCDSLQKDSSSTDKIFLKTMFTGIQRLDLFPAYFGDAFFEMKDYDDAILVYEAIIPCAANEQGRSLEWECYLYMMIGKCYEAKKDKETALTWYRKAIDPRFKNSTPATLEKYEEALCLYRCLMNIRCDY